MRHQLIIHITAGKRPRFNDQADVPKPTKKLEARKEDLNLEKNLNKTVLVQTTTSGKGPRGAGFYVSLVNYL
jgi:U4/U6.U5 tri-snRNP component SNU23